ncbi:uncharacterized protein LOC122644868 [Telopea speciosissima]|uniref:uncharacterized protein LOC122644868 n=1 Tax=Telopea speciosissima TaxID=54955 RepID=UPI001CC6DC3D|nr:uncharacterized protein LOC122644868 [Telopea speciosissima]
MSFVSNNSFASLMENEVECYRCGYFGHISRECMIVIPPQMQQLRDVKQMVTPMQSKKKARKAPKKQSKKKFQGVSKRVWVEKGRDDIEDTSLVVQTAFKAQDKVKTTDVLYVTGLKHNLLSASQICDKGHNVLFNKSGCEFRHVGNGKLIAAGTRTSGNLYTLTESIEASCLMGQEEEQWMTWVQFMKHKSEAFDRFKVFKNQVENETGRKLQCLRSDKGGAYTWSEFDNYCFEHGNKRQTSATKTPQQNGVAERKNRLV